MVNATPPSNGSQYTPQHAPRRRNGPRPSLSASFSLNPADTSLSLSDASLPTPSKGRAAFLSTTEQGHMGMSAQVSPRTRSPLTRGVTAAAASAGASGSGNGNGSGPSRLGYNHHLGAPGSEPRATRSRSRLSEAVATADDEGDDEDEDGERFGAVDEMRLWRGDAFLANLFPTAAFWGDKILAWTGDANDAWWLANTYYHMSYYHRAVNLLTEPLPRPRPKGKGRADGMEATEDDDGEGSAPWQRLIEISIPCQILAAQCLIAQEQYDRALEVVGTANPSPEQLGKGSTQIDGIKQHSILCLLRGQLHMRLSSRQLARESFVAALTLDVKNYDAFREIVDGQMMTAAEEWDFINNLQFRQQLSPDAAQFVKLMYVSKLRKDAHMREITTARRELVSAYGLGDNADVLVSAAEELFARYKWEDCYAITSRVLERIPGHPGALTLHLACMHHLRRLHSSLYVLAHDLVQDEPHAATTWYAVGLWYLTGKRWAEARDHFAKANLLDQRFAPAWIAFSHSFAWEGEHDQAISGYSTSAQLFPGQQLPLIGMAQQYLQLSNNQLAEEHLLAAAAIHASDPLLLNELGVAAYNRDDVVAAQDYFERAIAGAADIQGAASSWAVTHCNLGHALRVQRRYPESRAAYAACLRLDPTNACALSSQAMLAQLEGDVRTAIRLYHTALAVQPQDAITTVLLEMALAEQVESLSPTTLPGLPAAIAAGDMDPFNVPKGNPAFGPLPIEADPATLEEAGESFISPGGHGTPAADYSNVSVRRRHDASYSVGMESSAMDIEED